MNRSCEPAESQIVGHVTRARNAGAKSDAVVKTRHVVVHRFRDSDDLESFVVKPHSVAQSVVSS